MSAAPEDVWAYPRPPRIEPTSEQVTIELGGRVIAETTSALRVLETSHPPTYYLPRSAFVEGALRPAVAEGRTVCEWKGVASYGDVHGGDGRVARSAAWWYEDPTPEFEAIRDHVAVYPGRMDACRVDGELVVPQRGGFYGGWITSRVRGPFKGD
jgi:uncharacterized protein (DUF427 family)